jgi:shikimate kinase
MGTGKTSVGKELAKKTKRNFVDLDELIELREKRSIPDIFSKFGEPHFRKAEKRALKETSREKGFVIGCGGGIVLDRENIRVMRKSGLIVCLTATPSAIFKRVSGCSHRPLLNVADQKRQIAHLLKLRAPYYAQADKTINTSRLSIIAVAAKIRKLIPKNK